MKRRNFIKSSSLGFIAPGLIGNYGIRYNPFGTLNMNLPNNTDKVLVIIQLEGGNDGLNTLVPYDKWSELNNARPNIMLNENQLLDLYTTDSWKFHPGMSDMRDLFNEGKVRAIQSVGFPNSSHAHAVATDMWLNGVQHDQPEYFTGWAGRYLQLQYPQYPDVDPLPSHPPAIEIGDSQSLVFMEQAASMGVLMPNPSSFREWWYDMSDNVLHGTYGSITNPDEIESGFNQQHCHANTQLNYLRQNTGIIKNFIPNIIQAYNNVNSTVPTDANTLSNKLSIIANLIAGGLETKIYLVRHGSYDTHGNQLNLHQNLLSDLSSSIKSFMDELDGFGASDRVIGMTISEFGRTISSNSDGTDHGGPSSMFMFGNSVTGGVLGNSPNIPTNFNVQADDDLDLQFDLRDVYNTVLKRWFCVDQNVIDDNILFGNFNELDIISNPMCATCQTSLAVGGIVSEGTYQADQTITSDGVIPEDDVNFKASQQIELNGGFCVEPGASFSAKIEDCLPNSGN